MPIYRIKKGCNTSLKSIINHSRIKKVKTFSTIEYKVTVLSKSIYYHLNDNDLKYDLNKFPGLSLNLYPSDRDFVSLSFRSDWENSQLEITPYANINWTKIYDINRTLKFSIGESFIYQVLSNDHSYHVRVITADSSRVLLSSSFVIPSKSKYNRTTALWFGGDDTDENGLGGKTPTDFEIQIERI